MLIEKRTDDFCRGSQQGPLIICLNYKTLSFVEETFCCECFSVKELKLLQVLHTMLPLKQCSKDVFSVTLRTMPKVSVEVQIEEHVLFSE